MCSIKNGVNTELCRYAGVQNLDRRIYCTPYDGEEETGSDGTEKSFAGRTKNGLETSLANHIFDLLSALCGYGFNKSHGAIRSACGINRRLYGGCTDEHYGQDGQDPRHHSALPPDGDQDPAADINSSAATFGIGMALFASGLLLCHNVGENAIVSMGDVY